MRDSSLQTRAVDGERLSMGIEKRKSNRGMVSYRARLRLKDGDEVSSTHTRLTDARDWEARMRTAIKSGRPECPADGTAHTCSETIDRYIEQLPALRLKDHANRLRQARWWHRELGDTLLSRLTPARIVLGRDRLQTRPIIAKHLRPDAPARFRQAATVVRYLATLSHILTVGAEDWGWLEANPVRRVRKPKQPRGRVRYLSDEERETLLVACHASRSKALYPIVVIALATGMRKGEILSLRWAQVDLNRGLITLEDTKNGERRQIPLVGHALETLVDWSQVPHDAHDHVFRGKAFGAHTDIHRAWKMAITKAKISDFRFHD
jgi:integrase